MMPRKAWDRGSLAILNKNSPNRATDAHISIVGHITPADLRRELDSTEAANGFGNRNLWTAVKRSKFLPDGGSVEDDDFKEMLPRLTEAVDFARKAAGPMTFDADGHARWREIYAKLASPPPGLLGALTARAAPQVIRIALIYALLDGSPLIRLVHLEAALAVWNYCRESAAYIFGDSIGDPMADDILTNLRQRPQGMTRTEIRDLFGRNRSAEQIGRALATLFAHGRAEHREIPTDGRPKEVWFAIRKRAGES